MLFLWIATFALTVSPELHHLLHQDSQGSSHTCLITQLQQHQLLAGFTLVSAPVPALAIAARACAAEVQFLATIDYRLSPSRAPPALPFLLSALA
jgi:hypothetical protein